MATPAELMSAISAATGVPLATVTDIDRRLVKSGLRVKGGRGFNAARMTPVDAARLLTAILASPLATKSVEAVQRYAKAIVDPIRSTEAIYAKTNIPQLTALPARHSFVDALAATIAATASGALAGMITIKGAAAPRIEIFAFTRATYGRIRLFDLPVGISTNVEYLPPPSRGKTKDKTAGDLEQSRRVTERTIFAIGELLREDSDHERE